MSAAPDPRRVRYLCRRGMLELDTILNKFYRIRYETLTPLEQQAFANLLDCEDPDLFSWLMGYSEPEDKDLASMVQCIRTHTHGE